MIIKPLTDRQKTLIVNNIVKACYDINALNKTGYKYLYLANGFIAHYDLGGFRDYYSRKDLMTDVLDHEEDNTWRNFSPDCLNYDYYKSKREVYKAICSKIKNKTLNTWNT
jgi:hypothetical protein